MTHEILDGLNPLARARLEIPPPPPPLLQKVMIDDPTITNTNNQILSFQFFMQSPVFRLKLTIIS